jgi:hypothetical protein
MLEIINVNACPTCRGDPAPVRDVGNAALVSD